jgi:hypothetical protein
MSKTKPARLVLVEWLDSRQPTAGWQRLGDFEAPELNACVSVGWLVHDGKNMKAVATNMADVASDGNMQASGVIEIPTRCITKIKLLREIR